MKDTEQQKNRSYKTVEEMYAKDPQAELIRKYWGGSAPMALGGNFMFHIMNEILKGRKIQAWRVPGEDFAYLLQEVKQTVLSPLEGLHYASMASPFSCPIERSVFEEKIAAGEYTPVLDPADDVELIYTYERS